MKVNIFKSICFSLFYLLMIGKVNCQTSILSDQALLEKLAIYSKANPTNLLFVHTDKTIYTNNETVWFSAYLIKSTTDLKGHAFLSVVLVREDNKIVYMHNKYFMADGLSFGSLSLPDSIPPGNYQFIASSNVLDKNDRPIAVFSQPLTIKSITQQNFNATLSLLDTVITNGAIRAKVIVNINDPIPIKKNQPVSQTTLEYSVGKEKKQRAIIKGNSYVITIPETQLDQPQPVLLTSVKYNYEVQYLSLKLPEVRSQGINIRFFPEGGNLVDGLESIVGWEASTSNNLPVSVSGILYRDDQPIDTIRTNSYGIGTFRLSPNSISAYSLKIARNGYLKQDTAYTLPPALKNGVVMQLADAVVNDTLRITLFSSEAQTLRVLIHNYREAYASFSMQTDASGSKAAIALPITLPKGIITATVLDEDGRPVAERLFFAHYKPRIMTKILSDKTVYTKKDSVQLQLELTDPAGKPQIGIVSVAVVQDNRIESDKFQDIETYAYLNNDLGNLPQDPQGRGFNDKDYLEDILLVKGWRRYTWQSLINSAANDTVRQTHSPVIKGKVNYYGKPLKKPITINVVRDSLFTLISTEANGSFILSPDQLLTMDGRKVLLSVNKRNQAGYKIEIDDPYIEVNQKLAGHVEVSNPGFARISESSEDQVLEGLQRSIALRPITINGNKGNDLLYGAKRGPNACGDYVCLANILNCSYHFGDRANRPPVEGEKYKFRIGAGNKITMITYSGCRINDQLLKVDGIYSEREFYGVESTPDNSSEDQFLSTLFWKPGIIMNHKSESKFTFFTGDITGRFRIIVQGLGVNDLIFGEKMFTIK